MGLCRIHAIIETSKLIRPNIGLWNITCLNKRFEDVPNAIDRPSLVFNIGPSGVGLGRGIDAEIKYITKERSVRENLVISHIVPSSTCRVLHGPILSQVASSVDRASNSRTGRHIEPIKILPRVKKLMKSIVADRGVVGLIRNLIPLRAKVAHTGFPLVGQPRIRRRIFE